MAVRRSCHREDLHYKNHVNPFQTRHASIVFADGAGRGPPPPHSPYSPAVLTCARRLGSRAGPQERMKEDRKKGAGGGGSQERVPGVPGGVPGKVRGVGQGGPKGCQRGSRGG